MIVLMPSLEADHRLPLSGDVLSQVNQPAAIYASYIGWVSSPASIPKDWAGLWADRGCEITGSGGGMGRKSSPPRVVPLDGWPDVLCNGS